MSDGRRRVSLRWSLLRSFILLILLTSLIVLALSWFAALDAEKRLSSRLLRQGTDTARRELDSFLVPAFNGTTMVTGWGRSGSLSLDVVAGGPAGTTSADRIAEARRLNGLLLPYLQVNPALSSVQVANQHGRGFLVLLGPGDRVRNRVVNYEDWGAAALWFELDAEGVPQTWTWKNTDYDPRIRPWYREAVEAPPGAIAWTEPYVFATTKDLGITSSGRWEADGVDCVVAFDVLLTALTGFTQAEGHRVSPNALTMIASADWKVLGLPNDVDYLDPAAAKAALLSPVADLRTPEIQSALASTDLDGEARKSRFSFEHEGDGWWGEITPYDLTPERKLWITLLVPDRDLLREVAAQRRFLLIATAAALLTAVLYSWRMSRSYSRPLEALAAQSRRIRDLEFSSDDVIDAKLQEFHELALAQQQSLAALQSFSRYVPVDVVRELVAAGEVARIGGREVELTVLFTDIAGFTTISEGLSPQALTDHMARYFQAMIDTLQAHGATVDKMVGDAIVAFWGAPRRIEGHAEKAVQGVLECGRVLDALNEAWRADGLPALPTRFGLAAGNVVVGNIGARSRLAYTVLGDTVNFASRLEGLNKVYGTFKLADAAVKAACADRFEWRRLDRTVVRGKTEGVFVYEILGARGEVSRDVVERARAYEAAWDLYAARRFEDAGARLRLILAGAPEDVSAARLLERCAMLVTNPPPEGWDGTCRMTSK